MKLHNSWMLFFYLLGVMVGQFSLGVNGQVETSISCLFCNSLPVCTSARGTIELIWSPDAVDGFICLGSTFSATASSAACDDAKQAQTEEQCIAWGCTSAVVNCPSGVIPIPTLPPATSPDPEGTHVVCTGCESVDCWEDMKNIIGLYPSHHAVGSDCESTSLEVNIVRPCSSEANTQAEDYCKNTMGCAQASATCPMGSGPTPTPAPVSPTPAPVSPTPAPVTPSPTPAPATPSPSAAPATPSPTPAPATPSPSAAPATPSPTPAPATPSPTPTATPTSTPGGTEPPTPPATVCIDAEWIEAQGLSKVHATDGYGQLLCIVGLDELPCGTPDHILEVTVDGNTELVTYQQVCMMRECISRRGRFNGVLHSEVDKLPTQQGHRLTTLAHRGSFWSGLENRFVNAAQKLQSSHVNQALTYLQLRNSAKHLTQV